MDEGRAITQILIPGWSIIETSYGTGPYRVVRMISYEICRCGCIDCLFGKHHEGCVDIRQAWSIICVPENARPCKDGRYSASDFRYLNGYFVSENGEICNWAGDSIRLMERETPPPAPLQTSMFDK